MVLGELMGVVLPIELQDMIGNHLNVTPAEFLSWRLVNKEWKASIDAVRETKEYKEWVVSCQAINKMSGTGVEYWLLPQLRNIYRIEPYVFRCCESLSYDEALEDVVRKLNFALPYLYDCVSFDYISFLYSMLFVRIKRSKLDRQQFIRTICMLPMFKPRYQMNGTGDYTAIRCFTKVIAAKLVQACAEFDDRVHYLELPKASRLEDKSLSSSFNIPEASLVPSSVLFEILRRTGPVYTGNEEAIRFLMDKALLVESSLVPLEEIEPFMFDNVPPSGYQTVREHSAVRQIARDVLECTRVGCFSEAQRVLGAMFFGDRIMPASWIHHLMFDMTVGKTQHVMSTVIVKGPESEREALRWILRELCKTGDILKGSLGEAIMNAATDKRKIKPVLQKHSEYIMPHIVDSLLDMVATSKRVFKSKVCSSRTVHATLGSVYQAEKECAIILEFVCDTLGASSIKVLKTIAGFRGDYLQVFKAAYHSLPPETVQDLACVAAANNNRAIFNYLWNARC